jgi:hypothetical protein
LIDYYKTDCQVLLESTCIHAYTGYMEKLQILFSEPQLRRLRSLARRQDRPVSELVRGAVDLWLDRHADETEAVSEKASIHHCGSILADGADLRELANVDRA